MIPDTNRLEALAELRLANRLIRKLKLWSPELTAQQLTLAFAAGDLEQKVETAIIEDHTHP